ncbi:glycerol-3-phosphate dehydrogenase/oxidase [Limnoglobus roseus]|uniref:Glycerol-3-phosphate dehydrogenase n=1 Tax=Limnoglobus roseus TaxID=2598579 RepID=A0A5C1A7M7_9BACT|nr:glycerol-3-phosphate dehydrogenase/oxidase [Limnoglobus roseus]
MTRAESLARASAQPWDIVVIGGGATGAGVAVDAATRGYSVLLLEQHDFGKGTSSRSTKLVHGGVRYLERGDVRLVTEALRERSRLLANAPHLVRVQPFIVPAYRWWDAPYFFAGLSLYDLLAGRSPFGRSKYLNRREVLRQLPTIRAEGLRGGILYYDGQFDDARLLIDLIQTAVKNGATCLNYARIVRLLHDGDRVTGVAFTDAETGTTAEVSARVVVNATGAFCDSIRTLADPAARPMVTPSQGAHLVFDRSFLPGNAAMVVPKTPDGRVLFAIPWHGRTLVGTTDVPVPTTELEPRATEAEIDFILETAGRYLAKTPTRADVLSVFAGIRPLVKADGGTNTAALSRDHTIRTEAGLLTVTGGKWTTYRNMAEDAVNRAAELAGLPPKPCRTANLRITGPIASGSVVPLHPQLPYTEADIVRAVRHEMARTVEDVLSRRLRALILDADAAVEMAPRVAALMAAELGRDAAWEAEQVRAFTALARGYQLRRESA